MFPSFIASIMNIKSDIYIQQNVQDPNTGFINRQWVYNDTVICKIEPMKTSNASSRSENKTFDKSGQGGYQEKLQLRVKTLIPLSKRWRIGNIRSSDNKQIYIEMDMIDSPDTLFEIFSSLSNSILLLIPFEPIICIETFASVPAFLMFEV